MYKSQNNIKTSSWVEISTSDIASNLKRIKRRVGKETSILFVVKANAYGHGVGFLKHLLKNLDIVDYLGVSTDDEAIEIRRLGIKKPVLIMGALWDKQRIENCLIHNVSLTVSSVANAHLISSCASRLRKKAKIHCAIDTGMSRLGEVYCKGLKALFAMSHLSNLDLEGVYTHFPCADISKDSKTRWQIEVFGKIIELYNEMYPKKLRYVHAANSSAIFNYPESYFNMVRPGILAYGINPGIKRFNLPLNQALSWFSRIAMIKKIAKGESVSYARTFIAKKETIVAVIPVGYSSGYPTDLSNQFHVLIKKTKCRIIGRITMDLLMVDISHLSNVLVGEKVSLIDGKTKSSINIEQIAKKANKLPYEISCQISDRIQRIIK